MPSVNAAIMILLAERIVPTPIVIAYLGTFSIPKKDEEASALVFLSNVINLVFEWIDDPGSLNPIWPF